MSRYIDADAFLDNLKQMIKVVGKAGLGSGFTRYAQGFIKSLEADIKNEKIAPSIDIVRCKECKHNPWDFDQLDYTCVWDDDFADRPQTPDDFCSYGEREGE